MLHSQWIENEVVENQFSDARLTTRLKSMLTSWWKNTEESILSNSGSWADAMGSYRFLNNPKASKEDVLSGHQLATFDRMKAEDMVFIAQDTTFLSFTRDYKVYEKGTMRGVTYEEVPLHLSVAFGEKRDNLGVVRADFYEDFKTGKPPGSIRLTPIEEKKSYRWIEHYESACQWQEKLDSTCVVQLMDREADIHELYNYVLNQPTERRAEIIVRASAVNRRILGDEDDRYLLDAVNESEALGEFEIELPKRGDRKARKARLEVRSTEVTLSRSENYNRKSLVPLYVVQAKEVDGPEDEDSIDWLLLTTLQAESFEQAQSIIGWYSHRWEIEIYFRTLKQGCKIEDLKLQSKERLEKAICVYLIIAWKIHNLTMMNRRFPEEPAVRVFTEREIQIIYLMSKKKKQGKQKGTLGELVRMLAMMGGFLGRKSDGDPGIKNIWRGYRKLVDYVEAINAFEEICV